MFDCNSIIKLIKYYYWCTYEIYENWVNPPCKECGVKKAH